MSPGPVILVTGASRGIGAAAAQALSGHGARLALTARSTRSLAWTAGLVRRDDVQPLLLEGDLSSPEVGETWVEAALTRFGRIDAVINNAGVIEPIAAIGDADPEALSRNIAINLVAPMRIARAALPALRESRGRIVNVSSGAGLRPVPGWGAYCSAKAGLNNFTRVLAVEEPDVVSVAFSPGMTDTDMQARIREDGPRHMPADVLSAFTGAHARGALNPADAVGRSLAAVALHAGAPLSGEYVSIDDARVKRLEEALERRTPQR